MRLVIRPLSDPTNEIDVTRPLVKAIAEELWRHYGGNDVLNWIEAQGHVETLFVRGSPVRVVRLADLTSVLLSVPHPTSGRPATPRATLDRARRSQMRRARRRGGVGDAVTTEPEGAVDASDAGSRSCA